MRETPAYKKGYYHSVERFAMLAEWLNNKVNRKQRAAKARALRKKRLFFAISGTINAVCSRCGCDDWRLLEVNHKNGGGRKANEGGWGAPDFKRAVIQGRRKTDDLEILCRPCNAIHYLELKFGPLPMKVLWTAEGKGEHHPTVSV
jgi:hypothetical protein